MKKLRIFGLLSSIKSIELKRFQKYIKSDSLYNSRDYFPLVDHLLKFYPDFTGKDLTLDSMYNSLYPGKKLNNRVIISRLSELNRIVENFLLSRKLENDPFSRSKLLSEELLSRSAFDTFDLLVSKLMSEKQTNKNISEQQLYELDQLYMLKGQSYVNREKFKEVSNLFGENLDVFLIYFLSRLLTMYSTIKNIEVFQVTGTSLKQLETYIKNINIDNLVKSVKHNRLSVYLIIMSHIHKMYGKKSNDTSYFTAKNEFFRNIEYFERQAKTIIFSFLYSYCVRQLNLDRKEFDKEIYDILQNIIKYEGYANTGKESMPALLFREAVITGLKLDDIKWVEKFITNYDSKLSPEYRDTVYNYSLGKIKMHEHKYQQAMKLYDNCLPKIQIITYDIKIDKLVCLYETGLFDILNEEITRNKKQLKTNRSITAFHKRSFLLFNRVISKILLLKLKQDEDLKIKLKKEVQESKILSYKNWLLKKLNEIL